MQLSRIYLSQPRLIAVALILAAQLGAQGNQVSITAPAPTGVTSVSVQVTCGAPDPCSVTQNYYVIAKFPIGAGAASGAGQAVRSGARPAAGGSTNTITWTPVPGATSYDLIAGTAPQAPAPGSTGNFGVSGCAGITATTCTDTLAALASYTVPVPSPTVIGTMAVDNKDYQTPMFTFNYPLFIPAGSTGPGLTCPAGSNTQIQFNSNGTCGASPNFVYTTQGNVGIGTSDTIMNIQFPDPGVYVTAGNSAANSDIPGRFTAMVNDTFVGDLVGSFQFANYAIPTTFDRTVAAIQALAGSDVRSAYLMFRTANVGSMNERMRISQTGLVGINQTNPQYQLDVGGQVNSTTGFSVGGVTLPRYIGTGTTALNVGAVGANSCGGAAGATVTGILASDTIVFSPTSNPTSVTGYGRGLTIWTYAGANSVNFVICNDTAASITPGSLSVAWKVLR